MFLLVSTQEIAGILLDAERSVFMVEVPTFLVAGHETTRSE
jgi:cytochrome P450